MTKKVLIVAGDATESLELMYPYQRLKEEGYEVHIAAPHKKQIRTVVHDFEPGFDTYTEKLGYLVQADLAFKDVNPEDYVAIIIPGGRAPEYLRNDTELERIVKHFFNRDKLVAHLCHGSLILSSMGLLQGRRTAAYPMLKPEVERAGGTFVDGGAVVDGKMVSARAWPDHPTWMREFMKMLKSSHPPD